MSYDKTSADKYREQNREKLRQKQRAKYQERKLMVRDEPSYTEKTCCKCNTTKPLESFTKTFETRDGYNGVCKKCYSKYHGSGDRLIKRMWSNAKDRSAKKGILFTVTYEQLLTLERSALCPALGIPIDWDYNTAKDYSFDDKDHRPSLDRIVPELGYVMGNLCFITWRANRLKNDASVEEMKQLITYMEARGGMSA